MYTIKTVMTKKLQMSLTRLSKLIYTANIVLSRYPEIEHGQPLYLPNEPEFNDKTFIVSM